MNESTVTTQTLVYNFLKNKLQSEFDFDGSDECLHDTVDGECDLIEVLTRMCRDALRAEQFASAMKAIIVDNQHRKIRFEEKAANLRRLVLWAMQEIDRDSIREADMTIVKHRNSVPAVVITDPEGVPTEYSKARWSPDLVKIKKELLSHQLPFAALSNPAPYLVITTK